MTYQWLFRNVTFIYSDSQKTMKYVIGRRHYISTYRVTKQIVLPDISKISFLWNGSVYTAQLLCFMVNELFKVKLDPKNLLTFPELFGYHCMLLTPIPAAWGGVNQTPCSFFYITQKGIGLRLLKFSDFSKIPKALPARRSYHDSKHF